VAKSTTTRIERRHRDVVDAARVARADERNPSSSKGLIVD
jgi:hypothetical protein